MHRGQNSFALFATLVLLATSCSSMTGALDKSPPAFDPAGQTKCGVTKSQAKPLIVEWPSADRLDLEAQARKGIVAVRYIGCEMEVLRNCKVPGSYNYIATTRQDDMVRIRDEDELYANIPVYAAKFEGALHKAGELNVSMALVGKYETDRFSVRADELQGDCARATHVITAMTAGAFEFFAGASAGTSAGAGIAGLGAGAKSASTHELLNRAGDKEACNKATRRDKEPPEGCGALLRVEVIAVASPGATKMAASTPASSEAADTASATSEPPVEAGSPDCPPSMKRITGGAMAHSSVRIVPTSLLADAPPSRRRIGSFCMDTSEVSASAYTKCVKQNKCDAEGLACGDGSTYGVPGKGFHPINCVDYRQAEAYCRMQGKRLPTEEEWEWAARGGNEALKYPWGMHYSFDRKLCLNELCMVQSNGGDSPQGIHNLIGNVWEWTGTQTTDSTTNQVIIVRGAGFKDTKPELFAVSTSRTTLKPTQRRVDVGFRCVADDQGATPQQQRALDK